MFKMKIFGHVWPWPNFQPCLTLFLILKSRSHWMNESIPNPSYPDKNILKPIILRLCEPHRPSWMSLRTLTIWLGIKGERPFLEFLITSSTAILSLNPKSCIILNCIHLGTSWKNFIQSGGDWREWSKHCALPVVTTRFLWQPIHLGTRYTVTYCWYQPQSHCGDKLEDMLFSWFHVFIIYYLFHLFIIIFCEIWTLCMSWITFDQLYLYIFLFYGICVIYMICTCFSSN